MTWWQQLLSNRILWSGLAAMWLAQILKVPFDFITTRRWHWGMLVSSGGMPSSHSSLVCATQLAIGLHEGFNTGSFALATALAMIVAYDASGVRRQAGLQAQRINYLINELLAGHPISEEHLKEVLGHTPRQVIGGILLGYGVALLFWLVWH
jgi:acid phosphatase family membrane protein YuiD